MGTLATGRQPSFRGPFVPAATICRLIEPIIDTLGANAVARLAGITTRTIWGWRHGESAWVTFNVADRIITGVLDEPALWRTDPELAAVYETL